MAVPEPAATGSLAVGRMPLPRRPLAHLLLVCLFANFQQVRGRQGQLARDHSMAYPACFCT